MRYYPLMLDIRDRTCCVVGGGAVAERKVASLCSAGARVRLVSPAVTMRLERIARQGRIRWIKAAYSAVHLSGAVLVIAATADTAVNRRVSSDCRRRKIPVNVVDVPRESSFIVPSVASKGALIISISTSGKAPCLAKKIRQDLEKSVLPRYSRMLSRVSAERGRIKRCGYCARTRKTLLTKFVRSSALSHGTV